MYRGVAETGDNTILVMGKRRSVSVNVEKKELLHVDGKDLSEMEHNVVLDLSDDGERWEGDVFEGIPCGWGVLYNSEGEKEYEGFRIGRVNVGYGIQYYSDLQRIEYEGEMCIGTRWGRGIQYDRNGNTIFDGEWINGRHMETHVYWTEANQFFHNHVESLVVADSCCNGEEWQVLDLSVVPNLRLLQVGDHCFRHVVDVTLVGLHQLERVVIGEKSFTKEEPDWSESAGSFILRDCERVRELVMGSLSFSHYKTCEIDRVDSLELIEMNGCPDVESSFHFFHCPSFVLRGWRSLNHLL